MMDSMAPCSHRRFEMKTQAWNFGSRMNQTQKSTPIQEELMHSLMVEAWGHEKVVVREVEGLISGEVHVDRCNVPVEGRKVA